MIDYLPPTWTPAKLALKQGEQRSNLHTEEWTRSRAKEKSRLPLAVCKNDPRGLGDDARGDEKLLINVAKERCH